MPEERKIDFQLYAADEEELKRCGTMGCAIARMGAISQYYLVQTLPRYNRHIEDVLRTIREFRTYFDRTFDGIPREEELNSQSLVSICERLPRAYEEIERFFAEKANFLNPGEYCLAHWTIKIKPLFSALVVCLETGIRLREGSAARAA